MKGFRKVIQTYRGHVGHGKLLGLLEEYHDTQIAKERQKVAILKEALEYYTTNNDTPKVAENTLQKLKEME